MNTEKNCPRCGEGRLQTWSELDAEEKQVVPRLSHARYCDLETRKTIHSWCTRCWYESTQHETRA